MKGPPQRCPLGCQAPRGSQCLVDQVGAALSWELPPSRTPALAPYSGSGTQNTVPSLHPVPLIWVSVEGVCVLTSSVCCLPPPPPPPYPVALFSVRNLSRPSLTQYELDSKSCMTAPVWG